MKDIGDLEPKLAGISVRYRNNKIIGLKMSLIISLIEYFFSDILVNSLNLPCKVSQAENGDLVFIRH